MLEVQVLYDKLYKCIENNVTDRRLIKELADIFMEKGLAGNIPAQVFGDSLELEELTEMELITLTDGLIGRKLLNVSLKDFFGISKLLDYKTFKNDVVILKDVEFSNVVQISPNQWICPFWSVQDIFNTVESRLIRYNFETQRSPTYTNKYGRTKRKITLNPVAVDEIAEEFLNDSFTPNLITLNVPVIDKMPNITFKDAVDQQTGEIIKKLIITPDFDIESANSTSLDITDGYHRISGVVKAMSKALKEGKELNGGLIVSITCMTIEEAQEYVAREFKRNSTSKKYLQTLNNNEYNKFSKLLNKEGTPESNVLNNNIGLDNKQMRVEGKLTTHDVIVSALKQTNFKFNNDIINMITIKKFVYIINTLVGFLSANNFEYCLKSNMFIGYISIVDSINDYPQVEWPELLSSVGERIINTDKEVWSDLDITNNNKIQTKKIF
ncbi:MAG: hypothetical protein J6D47_01605, partial [Peptostreptococcaceae bacterium]|nr:hypothetical protein [Peptostreptococcaceae bacterium]